MASITKIFAGEGGAAYIGGMANNNWDRKSGFRVLGQRKPPGNARVFTSPCGRRVVVKGMGIEASLLIMHCSGMKDALRHALESGEGLAQADVRCLADFYAWYDVMGPLATLLEESPEACHYLAEHFTPGSIPQDTQLGITEDGLRLARCGDMARSVIAAKAARRALEEL